MNERADEKENLHEGREAAGEWMAAVSFVLFFISTTVFDAQIMAIRSLGAMTVFAFGLMFMQGYVLWYYFKRIRPASKSMLIAGAYCQLFVMAMVGTTVVALVGLYAIRILLPHG